VLFVGGVGLRKGVHYLAEATRILKNRGVACDVRVIGPAARALVTNPAFEGPSYMGQVPRAEVRREFLAADVFVLPSIAEGSATVTYEALASGLPVVTTPNAGSVVRDGVEGYVVPVRDAQILAERIEAIISDRDLRNAMSARARERAADYTWDRYGDRLLEAVTQMMPPNRYVS
jgi:glycosyltransferase involved in cell wall biosynthesis